LKGAHLGVRLFGDCRNHLTPFLGDPESPMMILFLALSRLANVLGCC
jgi:hypothetical protein